VTNKNRHKINAENCQDNILQKLSEDITTPEFSVSFSEVVRLTNLSKLIIFSIFLLALSVVPLRAEFKGEIYSEGSNKDTVELGMCLLGDSLHTSFVLKNTGSQTIKISRIDPSYFLGKVDDPGHLFDFEEFAMYSTQLPLELMPDSTIKITITYKARGGVDTNQYRPGIKYATLKLGMHDPDITQPTLEELAVFKKYILIAKKTKHTIDGASNLINFDSVYVNPLKQSQINWKVQNVSNNDLNIENYQLQMLSPLITPIEFSYENISLPFLMQKKSTDYWQLSYSPKDKGPDSAIFAMSYHPYPTQYPDSIDKAIVKMLGVGVQQNLSVTKSTSNFTADTIDIGKTWINTVKNVESVITNSGNINFGITQTHLWSEFVDENISFINIQKDLRTSKHITVNNSDTIKFSFAPTRRGEYSARYVIESDIANRSIKNVISSAQQKTIFIKGVGVESFPEFEKDSIEFGNVVLNMGFGCPNSKTFSMPINNTGNADLIIYQANVKPPFYLASSDTMRIPPSSRAYFDIVFSAKERKDYEGTLTLITNANHPNDTLKFNLRASVVSPAQVDLLIPNSIKAKPGRIITIPILVDTGNVIRNIVIAKTFNDIITYNGTILRYYGYESTGTASEGARQILIKEDTSKNNISISIEMQSNAYFLPRPVLLYLKFNTYLGTSDSTALAFAAPAFGDGNCSQVLLSDSRQNGIFKIDSVCGIEYKLIRQNEFGYLSSISPSPATDVIEFGYNILKEANTEISIYDINGICISSMKNIPNRTGEQSVQLPCVDLTPGIYVCKLKVGTDIDVKNFIIVH
jgi:hypothetical protein